MFRVRVRVYGLGEALSLTVAIASLNVWRGNYTIKNWTKSKSTNVTLGTAQQRLRLWKGSEKHMTLGMALNSTENQGKWLRFVETLVKTLTSVSFRKYL